MPRLKRMRRPRVWGVCLDGTYRFAVAAESKKMAKALLRAAGVPAARTEECVETTNLDEVFVAVRSPGKVVKRRTPLAANEWSIIT